MFGLLKSSFLWQFAGGFLLGAVGLVALHPGEAKAASSASVVQAAR